MKLNNETRYLLLFSSFIFFRLIFYLHVENSTYTVLKIKFKKPQSNLFEYIFVKSPPHQNKMCIKLLQKA